MRPLFNMIAAAVALAAATSPKSAEEPSLQVQHGQFVLTASDGTRLPHSDIAGIEVVIRNPANGGYRTRINRVVPDPHAAEPMMLYDISFLNTATGRWEPLCNPGPYGMALAVPVAGTWAREGRFQPLDDGRFTFNCTSGAHVKCLRMGHAPWKTGAQGQSLAPVHQACTRMMRADYCGTGQPFTVAGRQLQVFGKGDATPEHLFGQFEALWGENGAICLARARVPGAFPLDLILRSCPRLEKSVSICNADLLEINPAALLGNRS